MSTGILLQRVSLASSLVLLVAPSPIPASARQVSTTSDARVVGRVVTADGAPAPGVPMRIVKTDTGVFPGPSRTIASLRTGGDGRYSGSLPGAYIVGTETDADWIITASRPAGRGETEGATSSFELEVNTAVQEAPDLPLWESTPAVTIDGYRVHVSVPGGPPAGVDPHVVLGPTTANGRSGEFDLRSFEPGGDGGRGAMTAAGVAHADITVGHREGRTIYHQRIRTPTVAVKEPPLVPPSRGAPCGMVLTDGSVIAADGCAATDGDFSATVRPAGSTTTTGPASTTPSPGVASVTVELARATDVESVFVRRCDRTCTVEVSANGSSWVKPRSVEAGSSHEGTVLIARFEPVTGARSVRVSRPGGSLSLSEISAWPARPPGSPAPPTTLASTAAEAEAAPATPAPAEIAASRTARPIGPPLLATFLLGGVGAALAATTARRFR